ncbi:Tim44/TimA family putative adaptor protein [Novosphingobium tardum]|uniref:Tim44/TimA family putative adaptor protein n=1 Tax=Novosphingobium tardum TaxID=1538021 RepID=A0ABV8RPA8_9SPHN
MIIQIVILAMVAAFLGLRLYSVLGRRAEHNDEPLQKPVHRPDAPQAGRATPPAAERTATLPRPQSPAGRPEIAVPTGFQPVAERGIRAIVAADRRFDMGQFLEGAKGAYAMVLDAFWRGDKEDLRQLCDADVYEGFAAAIDAREAAGETLDNRLIRIEEATIAGAEFAAPTARITVRFVADVASVTRDRDGHVIAGSLDDAIESRDLWTFSRDVNSTDPDWLLDETDEG